MFRVRRFLLLAAPQTVRDAAAAEAGQGRFATTLVAQAVGCSPGFPVSIAFTSEFSFDDKTFTINVPPGSNLLHVNFSELGAFHGSGTLSCVFDEGGTFASTAINETGDFQWVGLDGEYMDRKPGISEGEPFPWVASARCVTTRTDDFKTLCENFELSWNGLGRAGAPNPGYNDFAGELNVRTAPRAPVDPAAGNVNAPVNVGTQVDGPNGHVPDVAVTFANGVLGSGELSIGTLADAHGKVPAGVEFPVRGTPEIDHGDGNGPVPFFDGGDERFIEIHTNAPLPPGPDIEVCLPMPAVAQASDVRPVRVLHGEGDGPTARVFVDRTSRVDHGAGKVCAAVSSFSKFAVVTGDVCGGGQAGYDGFVTIAGGLVGRKNVVVDGVTDCANYPASAPQRLAQFCVPDADNVAGQCSISLKLGLARAGCNRLQGAASDDWGVDRYSYVASLRGPNGTTDIGALFRDALYALGTWKEASVGPVTIALPSSGIAKYKLRHGMEGSRPSDGRWATDRDAVSITCIAP